jgi:pyrroloquinoline quinone (PQQ) biosynthesis protein C
MHVKMVDGQAVFATHLVRMEINKKSRDKLGHFQIESDAIVCYSTEELVSVESTLKELGALYTVESITHDAKHTTKAKGVKYNSRSEAIEHLLNDREVESQKLENILKKMNEMQVELDAVKKKMNI